MKIELDNASCIEIVKELRKLDIHQIIKLDMANDWCWAEDSLDLDLSEDEAQKIINFAHDIYMNSDYIPRIRAMDEIIRRINSAENPHDYIENKMYNDRYYIMEYCLGEY